MLHILKSLRISSPYAPPLSQGVANRPPLGTTAPDILYHRTPPCVNLPPSGGFFISVRAV
nr:MAG TPA: hypothetical protein [Caudoviricetes sp.]